MNEQWFLLGDIHGSAQPVHYFYQKNKERLSLNSWSRASKPLFSRVLRLFPFRIAF